MCGGRPGGRGRGRGGGLVWRDNAHGVAQEHTCAAEQFFAARRGALHASLCDLRELAAGLCVPHAVGDRLAEAGEEVWREGGLQASEECLCVGRLRLIGSLPLLLLWLLLLLRIG